jgi:hypothetical protein
MHRFLTMIIITGVPSGLVIGLLETALSGPLIGVLCGLWMALMFGLAMAALTEWRRLEFTNTAPTMDGERLIMHGPVCHLVGIMGTDGWLYLTDRRLLFRTLCRNSQTDEWSIPVGDILEARACTTAWVIPNGLQVLSPRGVDRFAVEGRRRWVEGIGQDGGQLHGQRV